MTTKTDGGSAFPHEQGLLNPGLTMRDYFAAKAMQGMLAHATRYRPRQEDAPLGWHSAMSKEAYELADAMLKARES